MGDRVARGGWSDAEMLEALDLRAHEGLTAAQIAARLGKTRGAVIGILNRIDNETNAHDGRGRAGIGNGTMARFWWRKGLAARGGA